MRSKFVKKKELLCLESAAFTVAVYIKLPNNFLGLGSVHQHILILGVKPQRLILEKCQGN